MSFFLVYIIQPERRRFMKKILFFILCFSITLTVKALEKEPIPNVFYKVSGSSEKKQMYYLHDGDNPLYFYDADIEITTDTEEVSEMPNFDENKLQYIKLANKVYRDNKSNINYINNYNYCRNNCNIYNRT